ncbi:MULTISPECIES: hypothetical protein [Aquimarina]|uniref:hypothetical protein n=1 Tax=Aquimarina TaxID=290174 RepID=UPI00094421D6|nr:MULTISPECIES: hypothetical protein [Aquimarina]
MFLYFYRTAFLIVFYSLFFIGYTNAQYAFEDYSAPSYKTYNKWEEYDRIDTKGTYDCTLSIDEFFDNKDDLTIQLTWFVAQIDFGLIRIFRNKREIQKIKQPGSFSPLTMKGGLVLVSDINGDGYKDIKLIQQGTGNGVMGMLVKVLYLFQKSDVLFQKISFDDMTFEKHRSERDVDNDGNYEIITMNLEQSNGHSYWAFNVFEYADGNLRNVNDKVGYPMVVQYTYKRNYEITQHMSTLQMKKYKREFPSGYDVK